MVTNANERLRLFGVDVDNLTMGETVDAVRAMVETPRAHSLVTVNLDHILKLQHDTRFRAAYDAASVRVADGSPFVLLSRIDRTPLKQRVAGSDLIEPVCAMAAREGLSVFFLGSSESRLARAAATLTGRHPSLKVVGHHAPPMGFDENEDAQLDALDIIRKARPDIILLALGAPKQEVFASRAVGTLDHGVFLNIGAGLDFIAGDVRRAPRWMQLSGTEWIYRALSEPTRLGPRYGKILLAMPRLLKHHYANRSKPA